MAGAFVNSSLHFGLCPTSVPTTALDKDAILLHFIIKSRTKKMRITVDIAEKDLASVQKSTGIRKRSPAVRQAIADYVREMERKQFLRRVMDGQSDYRTSNEELEARDTHDPD
jgi:metal-responsive CopG/Arc/MetJ family transcriptional regulator